MIFIMATGQLAKFNATKAFDVDGLTYSGNTIDFDNDVDSTEFSRDGSKLLHCTQLLTPRSQLILYQVITTLHHQPKFNKSI